VTRKHAASPRPDGFRAVSPWSETISDRHTEESDVNVPACDMVAMDVVVCRLSSVCQLDLSSVSSVLQF
jgi:hypothetical protein